MKFVCSAARLLLGAAVTTMVGSSALRAQSPTVTPNQPFGCADVCDGRPCSGFCPEGTGRSGNCWTVGEHGCECELFECPGPCAVTVDPLPSTVDQLLVTVSGSVSYAGYWDVPVTISGGAQVVQFDGIAFQSFSVDVPLNPGLNTLHIDAYIWDPPGCHSQFDFPVLAATGTPPRASPSPSVTATNTPTPVLPSPTRLPSGCVGDCGSDGQVTVDEIVLMVNILLNGDDGECPGSLGWCNGPPIMVDCLLIAINDALDGCAVQTPTALPTPTCAPTPDCPPCLHAICQPDTQCPSCFCEGPTPVPTCTPGPVCDPPAQRICDVSCSDLQCTICWCATASPTPSLTPSDSPTPAATDTPTFPTSTPSVTPGEFCNPLCRPGERCRRYFGGIVIEGSCEADCSCFVEGTPTLPPPPSPTPVSCGAVTCTPTITPTVTPTLSADGCSDVCDGRRCGRVPFQCADGQFAFGRCTGGGEPGGPCGCVPECPSTPTPTGTACIGCPPIRTATPSSTPLPTSTPA